MPLASGTMYSKAAASSSRPRCRERATYVHGLQRCEQLDDKLGSSIVPGCGVNSQAIRGSLADRRAGGKKVLLRDHARA